MPPQLDGDHNPLSPCERGVGHGVWENNGRSIPISPASRVAFSHCYDSLMALRR